MLTSARPEVSYYTPTPADFARVDIAAAGEVDAARYVSFGYFATDDEARAGVARVESHPTLRCVARDCSVIGAPGRHVARVAFSIPAALRAPRDVDPVTVVSAYINEVLGGL